MKEWLITNLEIIIKFILTILIFIPFIKTWKACEDEIKHQSLNLDLLYDCIRENEKRAKEFYKTQCKLDSSLLANVTTMKTEIDSYNLAMKDYNEKFFLPIKQQNEEIKNRQKEVFDLRKNEWKSLWPFLTALGLMWLGIKF